MLHLSSRIKEALYFASKKHDGQYRKGGNVPYVTHPVLVAFGVSEYTEDEEIITGALLHDVLEDCEDISYTLLQEKFGNRVAQMVDDVSIIVIEERMTWKKKKQMYLDKIKHISNEALVIVAVDKMVNMQAYFSALKERGEKELSQYFGGNPDEYLWYYAMVGDILKSRLKEHQVVQDYLKLLELCKK